jgi:hypothetical protein
LKKARQIRLTGFFCLAMFMNSLASKLELGKERDAGWLFLT